MAPSALAKMFLADATASEFESVTGILNALAKQPRDRYYKDQKIYLDGYTFTNCCFSNCTLVVGAGVFALKSCMIMANCNVEYTQPAVRSIKLFNRRNPSAVFPGFNPTYEPDGSITIE